MRCCAKADSAIHQTNHYPTDKYLGNQLRYAVDLTIIPRAQMGSESIALRPKAGWAIDSEAMRARGIIVLVKSN